MKQVFDIIFAIVSIAPIIVFIIKAFCEIKELDDFEKFFIPKYKLILYWFMGIILFDVCFIIFVFISSFYWGEFIKGHPGILCYINEFIYVSEILIMIFFVLVFLNFRKGKDTIFSISIFVILLNFILKVGKAFAANSSREIIVMHIVWSFIFTGVYLGLQLYFYLRHTKLGEGKKENKSQFILGRVCSREEIKERLYIIKSRNDNELILGDKETTKDSEKIYIFNKEKKEITEYKKVREPYSPT